MCFKEKGSQRPGSRFLNAIEWAAAGAGVEGFLHQGRGWEDSDECSCYHILGSGGFSEVSSLEVEQTAYNHTCLLDHSGEYMTKSTLPSLPKPLTPFFKLYVVPPTPCQYKCCLSVTKCIISNEIASMKLFHYHRNHSKKKKMALETPLFLYS